MFSLQQTVEAAKEVLKTVPEGFIYNTIRGNSCFYSVEAYRSHLETWDEDEAPSKLATGCFVGRVLDHLGVEYDRFSQEGVVGLSIDDKFDGDSFDFLERLQELQDGGGSWRVALELAQGYDSD